VTPPRPSRPGLAERLNAALEGWRSRGDDEVVEAPRRRPSDPLLDALRRPPEGRRHASRPVGSPMEPQHGEPPADAPSWVRRLDTQIVILPTLPGTGAGARRSDAD
jgi:hypothetical protein